MYIVLFLQVIRKQNCSYLIVDLTVPFEALYHAVPIICIPLFFDQFAIAQRIVSKGIGIRVDIASLTSDKIEQAVLHVLSNHR